MLRASRESFERQPQALLQANGERTVQFRSRLAAGGARIVGISWRSFQPKGRGYLDTLAHRLHAAREHSTSTGSR